MQIAQTFRTVTLKIKCTTAVYSASRTVSVILLCLLSVFLVDFFFELPAFLRVLSSLTMLFLVLYFLIRHIIGPFFTRISDIDVAVLLEKHYPQFNEMLTTYVSIKDSKTISPFFIESIKEQLSDIMNQLKHPKLLNTTKVIIWLTTSSIFLLSALTASQVYPEHSKTFLSRLLGSNAKWPGSIEFQVSNAVKNTIYVARGEDLTITLQVLNKIVPKVNIHYWTDKESVTQQMRRVSPNEFTYQFTSVLEDFNFYVYSSRYYSENFKVIVKSPASITRIDFQINFPRYLHPFLGESKIFANVMEIECPQQSVIDIVLNTNKELKRAEMKLHSNDFANGVTTLSRIASNQYTTSLRAEFQDAYITFNVIDKEGIPNANSSTYRLIAIKDDKPVTKFLYPEKDEEITEQCKLPINLKVIDDYGIESASLIATINDKSSSKTEFKNNTVKELDVNHTMDFSQYKVKENDIIKLSIEAKDIKDIEPFNISISKPLSLKVVSASLLEELFQEKILKLKQILETTYIREKDVVIKLSKIKAIIKNSDNDLFTTIKNISYDQENLNRSITFTFNDFYSLNKRIIYNNLFDEKARMKIATVTLMLGQLVSDTDKQSILNHITAGLFNLIKEEDLELRAEQFNKIYENAELLPETLHKIILALDDWLTYEAIISAVKKIKSGVELLQDRIKEQAKCEDCRQKKCKKHTSQVE
ncbi:MAG: hypothetical protein HY606_10065 [Planctomycetes bacterium]|nr:hypothetical protein [Planctomycetota bacterium]